jgi:hypothetical protein
MVMRGNIFCTGGGGGVKKLSQCLGQWVTVETVVGGCYGKLAGVISKGLDFWFLVRYGSHYILTPRVVMAKIYNGGGTRKPAWIFITPSAIRRAENE